jgi:hypothetical protein
MAAQNQSRVLKLESIFKRPNLLICFFFLIGVGGEHPDNLKVREKLWNGCGVGRLQALLQYPSFGRSSSFYLARGLPIYSAQPF